MHMLRNAHRRQAGDTIVEVLICIAVVSSVLIGAFFVANRSTANVQDDAEHSQAQQYLQEQIELLRVYLTNHPGFDSTDPAFCMADANTTKSLTQAPCKALTGGPDYARSITPMSTANTYDVKVKWSSTNGQKDQVEYFYRAYSSVATP